MEIPGEPGEQLDRTPGERHRWVGPGKPEPPHSFSMAGFLPMRRSTQHGKPSFRPVRGGEDPRDRLLHRRDDQTHSVHVDAARRGAGSRVLLPEANDEVPDFGLDQRPAGVTRPPSCPLLPYESRCQRSRIPGRTTNEYQLLLVIALRCSTFTRCRSTRSSMSCSSCSRPPAPRRRRTSKYKSENQNGAQATDAADTRIAEIEPFRAIATAKSVQVRSS